MTTEVGGQLGLDEQVVDDPSIEQLFETRERARERATEARVEAKAAHDAAMAALLEQADIPEGGALRVGRFRVTRTDVPPRVVAFETEPTSRLLVQVMP